MQFNCIKKKSELDKKEQVLFKKEEKPKKDNTTKTDITSTKNKKETPTYKEYKSSSPSLKKLSSQKVEESKPKNLDNTPTNESLSKQLFSNDELKTAWLRYAESIKDIMPRMYQVLLNHIPSKISENKIQVNLNNESQKKELIEKVNPKLMEFLIKELNNYSIELKLDVLEQVEDKNLIYTQTDKYNFLANKNKTLNILKDKFNLDFD